MLLANICHSHVPNLVNRYYCTAIAVSQYCTVSQRYYTHKQIIETIQYTSSTYSFFSTTAIQAVPTHRTVPSSRSYCTVQHIVRIDRYYAFFSAHNVVNKRKNTPSSFIFWRQQYSSSPQVLKPFRPYSLQDQDPRVNCAFDWPYFIENTSSRQCVLCPSTPDIGNHFTVYWTTHLVSLGLVIFLE